MFHEFVRNTGAVVMGRRAYDTGQGDFTDYQFQVRLFVLTHGPPAKVAKGENGKLTFTSVTDGIENAIAKARAAAGDRDVVVIGGASTAQQCMNAGLVDEIQISTIPVLLGDGLRLFEHLGIKQTQLERLEVFQFPSGRTDMSFRVVK
jgi:dihydrofolate reductase